MLSYGQVLHDKGLNTKLINFVSKDLFDIPFLDIYFCPFLENQNTFHFLHIFSFKTPKKNKID